jgi:hypothetical protein
MSKDRELPRQRAGLRRPMESYDRWLIGVSGERNLARATMFLYMELCSCV